MESFGEDFCLSADCVEEAGDQGVAGFRLFEFPFLTRLQAGWRKCPAKCKAGNPELPDQALFGGEIVEAFQVAKLAAAEDVKGQFLCGRGWRIGLCRGDRQKFRFESGGGTRLSGGHFLYGDAYLAGKITLKLLRTIKGGDAALGFQGAIEVAADFVEERLARLQLRQK